MTSPQIAQQTLAARSRHAASHAKAPQRYVPRHSKPRNLGWVKTPLTLTAVAATSVATVLPASAAGLPPHPISPKAPAPNLDPLPSYVGQTSCDPQVLPGTKASVQLVLGHYGRGRSLGIVRECGVGGRSEHKEGRAFDWGLNAYNSADKAAGDSFAQWVSSGEGARQLGVMYLIWNRRIWDSSEASQGWQPYSGVSPHTDHIHVSLSWAGALQRTSFWTGQRSTQDYGPCAKYINQPANVRTGWRSLPCPIPIPAPVEVSKKTYWLGDSGADVSLAQSKLGLAASGYFGSMTRSRIISFQRAQGLQTSGALDALTWAKLVPSTITRYVQYTPLPAAPDPESVTVSLPDYDHLTLQVGSQGEAVRRVQEVLSLPIRYQTGYFGQITQLQVAKFQAHVGIVVDGVVGPQTWQALEQREVVLVRSRLVRSAVQTVRAASTMTLRRGSQGPAVQVVQRALKIGADGIFGEQTQLGVWRFQRLMGLPRTGVVDARTWAALERRVVKITAASIR